MLRGIVLGDLWGIEEDVWVQLWSGTLGAVVSAGVAAWVAVSVLKRSNRKQQELVDQQLATQRTEAEQSRRSIILADLLSTANGFLGAANVSSGALDAQLRLFDAQAYRWTLEGRDMNFDLEMLHWSNVLWKPAKAIAEIKTATTARRKIWEDFLNKCQIAFSTSCLGVGTANDNQRPTALGTMKNKRTELELEWKSLEVSTDIVGKSGPSQPGPDSRQKV